MSTRLNNSEVIVSCTAPGLVPYQQNAQIFTKQLFLLYTNGLPLILYVIFELIKLSRKHLTDFFFLMVIMAIVSFPSVIVQWVTEQGLIGNGVKSNSF